MLVFKLKESGLYLAQHQIHKNKSDGLPMYIVARDKDRFKAITTLLKYLHFKR